MGPVTSVGTDSPVDGIVATVSIVLSLLVAVWALVAAVRQRPPDRVQFVGLAVLEVVLLVLSVLALVAVGGGDGPASPAPSSATWSRWCACRHWPGCWPGWSRPAGVRRSSCAVCLVTPVVVVRLQQTWEVLGG